VRILKTASSVTAMIAAFCATTPVLAESDFPARPIEVIVPYSSGGGVSNMARAFALEASQAMGAAWVVVNKDGAGGVVGFSALARAKPDGYTIAFSPASPVTNAPFVHLNMPFRNEQIEPVCQIFENVHAIVVRAESPLRSFEELVALVRTKPDTVAFAHSGPASVGQLSIAMLERAAKIKFNAIAYRGDAPALLDTLNGAVDFATLGVGTVTGKHVRLLAVLSEKRHPSFPDVPSVGEFGYPTNSQGLNGLWVPASTPRAIVEQYAAVCKKVATSPVFVERVKAMSQVMGYLDASDFKARIEKTFRTHEALVPSLKIEKN
jgi:tripartite-type tricarboxylate transporter receptor subunit TctC